MILKEHELFVSLHSDSPKYPPILLYGSNEGLIRENVLKIKKIFNKQNSEEIFFTGKTLSEQSHLFIDEVQTVSMFNDKKIIFIEQPLDKNVELFQECFAKLPEQILIIVIADILSKSSKVRRFFEGSNDYLCCANYDDDFKTNSRQIYELEKVINKVFDKDIKNYLNQNLSSDRMISKNEVDKLILLYSGNERKPELDDIQAIFNDNSQLELNKIPQVVFSGNPKKVSIFLKKLFDQGVNPVTILRTMLNYVQRIELTQIAFKKTNSFDDAIKVLKPPLFWKDKDIFQLHCKKWPIKETINNFNILINAELRCKSDYALTNILCERALLKIASKGKIYFQ